MADSDDMVGGDGGAGPGRRWDVALSFAGAQRDYVGQVAAALKARGLRCFYDADEQVRLWGTHLAEELPRIYAEESAAVVVFISAEYADGEWTQLERRAALARAVAEAGVYVLPARFDDSELPGLLPDVVTVDLRRYTPEQFAGLVAEKVAGTEAAAPGRPSVEVGDPFALEVRRPVQPEAPQPGLKLTARERKVFGASSAILGVFSATAGLVSFYVHGGTPVLLWSAGLLAVASVMFIVINRNIGRRVGLPLLGAVSALIAAVIVAAAIGGIIGYHIRPPAYGPASTPVSVPIPMSAACKWAYPGQASGEISGSGYSIACLNATGQVLGGFGGSHSLNAWCADPRHADGENGTEPKMVNKTWVCT